MNVTQTTATTIDTAAPATFTCAQCPFARLIEDNRYCCQVSQTASDVKRGHWEATVSCFEALAQAKAEAEKVAEVVEVPIAQAPAQTETPAPTTLTSAPSKPAAASHATTTAAVTPAVIPAPTAIETDNQPPGRGDGRGRVQPIAHKKLLPSLVAIKRISSDIPASNFDQFELEILGELSLAIGGFIIPPVLVRDSSGYKVISGDLQYHAAVLAGNLIRERVKQYRRSS